MPHKKALCPAVVVPALLSPPVLAALRRELESQTALLVDVADLFSAVQQSLSPEALLVAGDIPLPGRRGMRRPAIAPVAAAVDNDGVPNESSVSNLPFPPSSHMG